MKSKTVSFTVTGDHPLTFQEALAHAKGKNIKLPKHFARVRIDHRYVFDGLAVAQVISTAEFIGWYAIPASRVQSMPGKIARQLHL